MIAVRGCVHASTSRVMRFMRYLPLSETVGLLSYGPTL
jgi:hypothetical protein